MSRNGSDTIGTVLREGEKGTLVFSRRIRRPPEAVWKALTDPAELSAWYMTRASIDGRLGGAIDFVAGPSRLHVTGRILTWDPPSVFEHEWKVDPVDELPAGENAIIRWELIPDGECTVLHLRHSHLSYQTAVGFAPGTHSFLDRLEAQLTATSMPSWMERYREVAPEYPPSWVSGQQESRRQ